MLAKNFFSFTFVCLFIFCRIGVVLKGCFSVAAYSKLLLLLLLFFSWFSSETWYSIPHHLLLHLWTCSMLTTKCIKVLFLFFHGKKIQGKSTQRFARIYSLNRYTSQDITFQYMPKSLKTFSQLFLVIRKRSAYFYVTCRSRVCVFQWKEIYCLFFVLYLLMITKITNTFLFDV